MHPLGVGLMVLLWIAGCMPLSPAVSPARSSGATTDLVAMVFNGGRLECHNVSTEKEAYGTFAREVVRGRRVILKAADNRSLAEMLEVRDQLKAAGVRDVVLEAAISE